MNWKTTVAFVVIVLGLGLYLKYYEMDRPDTAEAARQSQRVVNLDRDKIDGIVIQNGDEKIDLQRRDNKWRLEAPIKDQADASAIQSLLSEVDEWRKDATISAKEIEADKNKMAEYGLNKPKLRLKLSGKDAPPEILFGKDAALEGKIYARFENSKDALLVGQSVKKAIDKKPEDFRDRRLTDLNTTQVSRVVLKTKVGEMELQKKGSSSTGVPTSAMTADHWEIVKPLRARADDQKVNDLIAQVSTAHIEQFVADDRGDLHPYGLAEPRGSVTLFGQDDKQGQMLQIGSAPEKQKEQVYVRFTSRGFVYTLPKKIEALLDTKPDDLRDRHLVRIDTNILDRITISNGKDKTVLARKGEDWSIVDPEIAPGNVGRVRKMIDTLQNEQVTKFVEDVASNLGKYGLDKPQLQVVFSSFASENTAETKAGEKPFATLSFGKVEGDTVYARLDDEPFIVAIRRGLIDQLSADPLQWQDLALFKVKPEQVRRFSIATDKDLGMERDEKKPWRWVKGEGQINQANADSFVKTLANLRAVRWVGPTVPQQGLDKPQVTITFMFGPDKDNSHTLKVGAATSDRTWYARVEGRDGTLTISDADLNALKVSLVSQATPSPSAIASPMPSATP